MDNSTTQGEPDAWAALRENGTVYACHEDRDRVVAVAGDRQIVPLWLRSRDSLLSPEPVAYCVETPLHGWEIASADAAAQEPALRWRKMTTLTDAELDLLRRLGPSDDPMASFAILLSPADRRTVNALLERLGGGE